MGFNKGMLERLSDRVEVGSWGNVPKVLIWKGRTYRLVKVGLHHTYHKGKTLFHVFSVVSENLFFRLVLNSESLNWTLEEVADGLPT